MKIKVINDITYYVIKDDNDILSTMDISDKLTEYFDDFDYIVGDISYSVIRLKGFYRDSKSNNKFNKISFLNNYLEKYCSYGAKWFIISKIYKDIK